MPAAKPKTPKEAVKSYDQFALEFSPLERQEGNTLLVLIDDRTGAHYCECHIRASKLITLGTTDVPLDPDEQSEYRANRDVVLNHPAFQRMKDDAIKGRAFSNIVAEYSKDFDAGHPLKIIGGQHRFEAIKAAIDGGRDEWHGVKVYLDLNTEQRLDVQLISNTNIAISGDLLDRMQETVQGPHLRDWCQKSGFLPKGEDFADHRERGGPISVRMARAFILNYFKGREIDPKHFSTSDTTPSLNPSGQDDPEWETLKSGNPTLWDDQKLTAAGQEFSALVESQRAAFSNTKPKPKPDYPEKALNGAILTAWAYVAGMLHNNEQRLRRHFNLRKATGRDPLNAAALAKGRHKSDPENYRGLGYRTDPRERGRFVELFYQQTEKGDGITPTNVDIAIKQYHAKQAQLEVIKAKAN